jgi:hypothetical protein
MGLATINGQGITRQTPRNKSASHSQRTVKKKATQDD